MPELIESIEVRGFRGLGHLLVPTLGRVNLITGKNNAGKSSLLEAIRILVTRGALDTVHSIIRYREENNDTPDADRDLMGADFGPYRSLFQGFPDCSTEKAAFSIQASGRIVSGLSSLSVAAVWAVRHEDAQRGAVSYQVTPDLFGDVSSVPALEMVAGERTRVVPLPSRGLMRRATGLSPFGDSVNETLRCVYLDPFSPRSTGQLGTLWDAVALTDAQDEVLKALQLLSPDIQAVSMVGSGDSGMRPRTAMVRSRLFGAPVPLRTFGDGVNRLFGIVLSICNAKNGVLLMDEFENGLHHSVQAAIWTTIFRLAADLNVQVFATSHSHDCVQAFQEAASDSPQEGVLLRLTRRGDAVMATVFREEELEIATRNDIEVR